MIELLLLGLALLAAAVAMAVVEALVRRAGARGDAVAWRDLPLRGPASDPQAVALSLWLADHLKKRVTG